MTALPVPPSEARWAVATGINNAGLICGRGNIQGRKMRALLWRNGALEVLPILPDTTNDEAYAINDSGVVGGDAFDGSQHTVFWDAKLQVHDLPHLGFYGRIVGINSAGQMVAMGVDTVAGHDLQVHAARIEPDGKVADLGSFGGPQSMGRGIDSHGDVVGYAQLPHFEERGYLYHDGRLIDLGVLPGAYSSEAKAINDTGEIVGNSQMRLIPPGQQAVLWKDNQMIDLNNAVDNLPKGMTLTDGIAINNRGQIVCLAQGASAGFNPTRVAALLTPEP